MSTSGELAGLSRSAGKNARVSAGLRFRRWLLRSTFRIVFRILYRVSIVGLENVPAQGPYLIALNHVSIVDPPFVLSFWRIPPEALSAFDVFGRPGQGLLVRAYEALPVHRERYDREVIEKMIAILRAGRPLMIAPEGGRSHQPGLRRARPGVAYLMDRARVPVVPVAVVGSSDDELQRALRFKRPPLEMRIGGPFTLPPISGAGEARRQSRQHNADFVMQRIAALLPPEYRGVYSS